LAAKKKKRRALQVEGKNNPGRAPARDGFG